MQNLAGKLCAFLCLSAPVHAQSFNIDMGSSAHPVPSASFGGGANQPGVWNSVDQSSVPPFSRALDDLAGVPTSVTVTVSTSSGSLTPTLHATPPGFTADQAALFDDSLVWLTGAPPAPIWVTLHGLIPGSYEIYAYAGDLWQEGSFYVSGCTPAQVCMYFDGTFTQGSVWGTRCCGTSTGDLYIDYYTCYSPLSYPAVNALQLVRRAFSCADVSEPFCSGAPVGGTCACPCGNCGLPNRGCDHSFLTGGARLFTSGTSSVVADSLVLRGEFLPPTSSTLFYQGTGTVGGGFGTLYGDGLRCVGGSSIRLGTRFASGGVVAFGAGQGTDPLVSIAGAIPPAGGTRYYQLWYRNAPVYCTPSTVNLSNGFKVRWAP